MVSWLLILTVALGTTMGLLTAQADPAEVAEPMEAEATETYQQICHAEALNQGAPETIAQGACRCLQERLDTLSQQPTSPEELQMFTEENRLACVFQAILEL